MIILAIDQFRTWRNSRRPNTQTSGNVMLNDLSFNPYNKSGRIKRFLRRNFKTLIKRPFSDVDKKSLREAFTTVLTYFLIL